MRPYYILLPLTLYDTNFQIKEKYIKYGSIFQNTINIPEYDYMFRNIEDPTPEPYLALYTKEIEEEISSRGIPVIRIRDAAPYNKDVLFKHVLLPLSLMINGATAYALKGSEALEKLKELEKYTPPDHDLVTGLIEDISATQSKLYQDLKSQTVVLDSIPKGVTYRMDLPDDMFPMANIKHPHHNVDYEGNPIEIPGSEVYIRGNRIDSGYRLNKLVDLIIREMEEASVES